jgi:predicted DNA-binding transcriptional regulator AlpA
MEKLLLTDKDVAALLSISKVCVWNYEKCGLLPKPYKFGGNTRWKRSEIEAAVDNLGVMP